MSVSVFVLYGSGTSLKSENGSGSRPNPALNICRYRPTYRYCLNKNCYSVAAELPKVKVEAWKEKSLGNLMFDRFDGANEKKKIQCFRSASIVMRIRILVLTFLLFDPDPKVGGDPKHKCLNCIIPVAVLVNLFCCLTFLN